MEKRICPVCGLPAYSAVEERDWICPNCGGEIPRIKQNGPQALPSQTDREENSTNPSISQRSFIEALCDGDLATKYFDQERLRQSFLVLDLV